MKFATKSLLLASLAATFAHAQTLPSFQHIGVRTVVSRRSCRPIRSTTQTIFSTTTASPALNLKGQTAMPWIEEPYAAARSTRRSV
jgi:hypothetical protein